MEDILHSPIQRGWVNTTIKKQEARDFRAIAGINLALNSRDQLNKTRKELEELELAFIENRSNDISRSRKQLKAIQLTAGDPDANDALVDNINRLERAIGERWQHLEFIIDLFGRVVHYFNVAVSKHNQRYEGLNQDIMVKSFKDNYVLNDPKLSILPKWKRKKRVAED